MSRSKRAYVATKKIGGEVYDCKLALRSETGLGSALSPKKGLLVAAKKGEEPAVFAGLRSMDRAIARVQRTAITIRGSMIDGLIRLQPVIEPGEFSCRTFHQ